MLTDDEIAAFGIAPQDEYAHPYSPDHEWWNESWFWDWFRPDGSAAGHLRIGVFPNQRRVWLWLLLFDGDRWVALEETRLPLGDWDWPDHLTYDRLGLRCSWEVGSPLRSGRLRCEGFGRVVSGPRAGLVLPVACDLEITAEGVPHSSGEGNVEGHMDESYSTSRFEQPVSVAGSFSIGPEVHDMTGQGERDHSWGPRDWNLEWAFLVMGGHQLRMQWAAVDIEGLDRISVGYLKRGEDTRNITEVDESLHFGRALDETVSGPFRVTADDGSTLEGEIETISAAEIDIAHCFVPPRPSTYRRALIRVQVDGERNVGWLEVNRFDPARRPG